jgi:hypothetical protein
VRALSIATLLMFIASGCATLPSPPVDPATRLLEAGESIRLRVAADLMHGHDMEEPPYDEAEGYRPIPTYPGELLVTDRRLLFVARPAGEEPSWASIPYALIARARPSRTPLLNYIVVWDTDGHADSFVVDASDVRALHQVVGQALMTRGAIAMPPATHAHRIK